MGLNDTPWFSMGLDRFDTLLEGGSLAGFPWNPMSFRTWLPSALLVDAPFLFYRLNPAVQYVLSATRSRITPLVKSP